MLSLIKKITPNSIISTYHYLLSWLGAVYYRHPSRHLKVVGVTGTKGKSTVTELVGHILEAAGHKVALAGTIRFKIGDEVERNLYKMTMPGRFFIQKFLARAKRADCDWVVLEMTSEGAKQFRHRFVDLDALIFTNLSPEHIESHGSYEKYKEAKLSIARRLASKHPNALVVNGDDAEADAFLALDADQKVTYSPDSAEIKDTEHGIRFTKDSAEYTSLLRGKFNAENILAAVTFAAALGIDDKTIRNAVATFTGVPGRVEKVKHPDGKELPFEVYVDYAHTADSLEKLFQAFEDRRIICAFGATGGGRDHWKREKMGEVADRYCASIVLTNDDPYDEDPQKILDEIAKGITNTKCEKIVDRRKAIRTALAAARPGDVVLIAGKGTDPYLMVSGGKKIPWDDVRVTKEELSKLTK